MKLVVIPASGTNWLRNRLTAMTGFNPLSDFRIHLRTAITLVALISGSLILGGRTFAAERFRIAITNELGVTATVVVTHSVSGRDAYGDRNHDFITQELNFLGGEWHSEANGFSNSRLALQVGPGVIVLVPWKLFKAVSLQGGSQTVTLTDGTEYKGRLRTILKQKVGSDEKTYELGGASSMSIVEMPEPPAATISGAAASAGASKGSQWRVTRKGMPDFIVAEPHFVYSWFHVTSGGGMFVENGFYETKVSEAFGVVPKGRNDYVSANISDFEKFSIGGDPKGFGQEVTVKAKDADAIAGSLAVTPFGLDSNANQYLNRSLEVSGTLSNECTVVFSEWHASPDELKFERIQAAKQVP